MGIVSVSNDLTERTKLEQDLLLYRFFSFL